MSGTQHLRVEQPVSGLVPIESSLSNSQDLLQTMFSKILDVDRKVEALQVSVDNLFKVISNNSGNMPQNVELVMCPAFEADVMGDLESASLNSSSSDSSFHLSVRSSEALMMDPESLQPSREEVSTSFAFLSSLEDKPETNGRDSGSYGDSNAPEDGHIEKEETKVEVKTDFKSAIDVRKDDISRKCKSKETGLETTPMTMCFGGGGEQDKSFISAAKHPLQLDPVVIRPESPLPIAYTKRRMDYSYLKRNKCKLTEDNRVKYFENTVDFTSDIRATPTHNQEIRKATDKSQSNGYSSEHSAKFVPNNQLIPASGLKNDHGPYLDNRFEEDAHSDSPSFLAVVQSQLPNMATIQTGSNMRNDESAHRSGPTISTDSVNASKHATRKDGDGTEDKEDAKRLSWASGRGVTSNIDPSNESNSKPPVHGTLSTPQKRNDETREEADTMVGDAYIQAFLQTQKQDAQQNSEPKSQGLDTVICVDTSQSMNGQPLEKAQQFIMAFVDGLETATVDFELEENVSIVTFGKTTKVQQHLTNNYDAVRDVIQNLEAGGPSPMWLGLALALSELGTRGGSCTMSNIALLPRIILLSDGFATEKNKLSGRDSDVTQEQTMLQIQFLISRNRKSVSKIHCVTFGNHNKQLLSKISGGDIYTEEDFPYLTEFFRSKEITNDCLVKCGDQTTSEQSLIDLVDACGLQDKRSVNDVLSKLKTQVSLGDQEMTMNDELSPQTQSPSDTPETISMETEENGTFPASKDLVSVPTDLSPTPSGCLPEFGARVLANSSWEGYDKCSELFGTVIGLRKDCVKVLWSDGTINKCRYGLDGQYDVSTTDSVDIDTAVMQIGAKVQRGEDWKWGEQDGGNGCVGVVIKQDKKKKVVFAIWPNNQQGNYRYGYKHAFDVQLINTVAEKESRSKKDVIWQIELSDSEWSNFPREVTESIEDMYMSKPKNTFLIRAHNRQYRISLVKNEARDLEAQIVYPIRRQLLSEHQSPEC